MSGPCSITDKREIRVETHGGELGIRWPGGDAAVMMTGDAVRVFDGEIEIQGEE